MTDDLPTARTMLRQDAWLCLLVWCKACPREPASDHRRGRGDVPRKDLKFRCTQCGSRLTDFVVMSRDALGVQPWRQAEASGELVRLAHGG